MRSPRYARITWGCARRSVGAPWSDLAEIEHDARSTSITISMTCSTIITVTPCRAPREYCRPVCASTGVSPVSISRADASVRSQARAPLRGVVSPTGQTLASRWPRAAKPEAPAFRGRGRATGYRDAEECADHDVLHHLMVSKLLTTWKIGRYHAGIARCRQRGDGFTVQPISPASGHYAGDHIEQRRLAGAVGTDQPDHLAPPDRDRCPRWRRRRRSVARRDGLPREAASSLRHHAPARIGCRPLRPRQWDLHGRKEAAR